MPGTERTCTVMVPADLLADIDRLIGPEERERFIAECLRAGLAARWLALADRAAGALADLPVDGWSAPDESDAWVRQQRQAEDRLREARAS